MSGGSAADAASAGRSARQRSAASRRATRVGVVGCGYWGPKLARNFAALPDAELVAVADPDAARRASASERFPGVTVVGDHDELLALDLDAVAVATPVSTHHALGMAALAAGRHLLLEKPLARSVAEADALVETAERAGLTLMVGHTFAYNPAVELLSRMVADGELGRIYYVHAARLNLGIFQSDINVLWDLAPHDLSILMAMLQTLPCGVRAHGEAFVRPGIEDVAWLVLDFPGGIVAQIHASWLDPCKTRRVTVVGDRRMVVYDDVVNLDKITVYDRGVDVPPYTDDYGEFHLSYRYGDVRVPRLDPGEPLRYECAHFVACVRTGDRPRTDGRAGRDVVRILAAADRSLAAGGARVALQGAEAHGAETAAQRYACAGAS